METSLSIKNFRIFDREGATIGIRPITILTGCNSSGKSSIVKSLILLDRFLERMAEGDAAMLCYPENYPLRIISDQGNLGQFYDVLNSQAEKDEPITLGYSYIPALLDEKLSVAYEFKAKDSDIINNGWLSRISVKMDSGETLFEAVVTEDDESRRELRVVKANLGLIKEHFLRYSSYCIYRNMTAAERGNRDAEDESVVKEFVDNVVKKSIFNILGYNSYHTKNFTDLSSRDCFGIAKMIKTGIVTYMPAFDMIAGMSVDGIRKVMDGEYWLERNRWYAERILKDFQSSGFDTIIDYYKALEEKEGFSFGMISNHSYGSIFHSINEISKVDFEALKKWEARTKEQVENDELSFFDIYYSFLQFSYWTNQTFQAHCDENSVKEVLSKEELDNGAQPRRVPDHPTFALLRKFFSEVLLDTLMPSSIGSIQYVSSTKAAVKRVYSIGDTLEPFDNLLMTYLDCCKEYRGSFKYGSFINEWINKFEIGFRIEFKATDAGGGIIPYLYKNESDSYGHPLADEGYGITQLLAMLISIEVSIMSAGNHISYARHQKRYDYHLLYPTSTVAVEEPEIHLHPRFQSLLAELFVDANRRYNVQFIVETHSEYLIRKMQTLVAQNSVNPNEGINRASLAIFYIDRKDETSAKNEIREIEIREDGCLANPFGPGFFDEASSLSLNLLKIKAGR